MTDPAISAAANADAKAEQEVGQEAIAPAGAVQTPEVIGPPPCYFWNVCSQRAAIEKAGRAVCSRCAANLRGYEYPLRAPSRAPIYKSGREVADAMNVRD
jgi:hypothetical protein